MKFLAITTGDPDGIGLEVTLKSLRVLSFPRNMVLFVWRKKGSALKTLSTKYRILPCEEVLFLQVASSRFRLENFVRQAAKESGKPLLFDIQSSRLAPFWFEAVAMLCHRGVLDGVVTGPLSKTLIRKAGLSDLGHTEILARVCKKKNLFQGYLGNHFNVVLLSAHLPLRKSPSLVTPSRLRQTLEASHQLVSFLSLTKQKKPIALLGLNPHAGEDGMLGREERTYMNSFCTTSKVVGPLSPDAAFLSKNWSRFSCYLACYHDQGLIPFKLVHGQNSGLQVTLGLPFPRTSVDHGTAKDIFGKNKANPHSMMDAIKMAVKMLKKKRS